MINVHPATINFLSIARGFGLKQFVDLPTHITTSSSTTLDLVLSNISSISVQPPLSSSDDCFISLSLSFYLQQASPTIPEANLFIQEH